ncbi:MAG: hypothetical protein JXR83_16915 [Deltaproteobacteria bacterium]|nr:hypothetical protein [Deltaproteobacteria bacterium]
MATSYEVLRGEIKVLAFDDRPGVLVSTAPPTPGFVPPQHPFLNGRALDAQFEHELAALLGQAHSVAEFIELLRQGGYEVRERQG